MIEEIQNNHINYVKTICPYCGILFNNTPSCHDIVANDNYGAHKIISVYCTNCSKPIIILKSEIKAIESCIDKEHLKSLESYYPNKKIFTIRTETYSHFYKYRIIMPEYCNKKPIPKEVADTDIIQDYNEACLTLQTSIRASAALSRRCLQTILEKNNPNLKSDKLSKQVEEVIKTENLPSSITDLLHAVREIGNISVHPIKDINSGTIIETSLEEAEMNLEVIEALFDYYYVMPARNLERKNKLNQKLLKAGRKTV